MKHCVVCQKMIGPKDRVTEITGDHLAHSSCMEAKRAYVSPILREVLQQDHDKRMAADPKYRAMVEEIRAKRLSSDPLPLYETKDFAVWPCGENLQLSGSWVATRPEIEALAVVLCRYLAQTETERWEEETSHHPDGPKTIPPPSDLEKRILRHGWPRVYRELLRERVSCTRCGAPLPVVYYPDGGSATHPCPKCVPASPDATRRCSGGTQSYCGKPATVVCSLYADGGPPLEWYACDDREHHGGANALPIAEWRATRGLPPPASPPPSDGGPSDEPRSTIRKR